MKRQLRIPLCLNAVQAGKVMAGIYRNWDAAVYAELCRKFGLPDKKQYKDYSTGMKMKLCIAVALAHHPKLLLLDEATNGLDPVVRDEVTDLLLDFTRDENHSILISSHIVSDLEKLCDIIAFLHKGRLLLCEEKDALREEYALWHGTAVQLAALDMPFLSPSRQNSHIPLKSVFDFIFPSPSFNFLIRVPLMASLQIPPALT